MAQGWTSEALRNVIDAREFQRLRNIKQMGVASYVFPGAEHSRFAHSLGVQAIAEQLFQQLRKRVADIGLYFSDGKFDDASEIEFSIAALCHDIGHTAYSHVLETKLLPYGITDHEGCAIALLEGRTEIYHAVANIADVASVIGLLNKRHPNKALSELIAGTIDVDRCDYILRDARMSGVKHGEFDLDSLLSGVTISADRGRRPVLMLDGSTGVSALRQFLSARRSMHREVYLHSAVRAAQILQNGIFNRMQDIGPHGDTLRLAPPSLHPLVSTRRLSMEDFIRTTDVEVLYMIRSFASDHLDPTLNYLSRLFVSRSFPKCVLETAASDNDLTEELRLFVADKLKRDSLPPEAAKYLVWFDSAAFSSTSTELLVSFPDQIISLEKLDASNAGPDIAPLLQPFSIARLFVPSQYLLDARDYIARVWQ